MSDGGLPWNDGLELARSELRPQPAAVLYLAGDLPLLTAAEVRRLADAAQAGTVVVGRARDAGTNALAVQPRRGAGRRGSASRGARRCMRGRPSGPGSAS